MSSAPTPFGYMPPHWLDELFAQGAGDYNRTWNVIIQNRRFCDALIRASLAYREAQRGYDEAQSQGHPFFGAGPDQSARVAFLHELNQDDVDRTGYGADAPS